MIAQFKDWYTIDEAAEILECKVDDVDHFIKAGKIKPVFWFDNEPAIEDYGKGETYPISVNGLYACLISVRYSLHGLQPVVYPIDDQTNRMESFERAFTIFDSFGAAREKKDTYPHIMRHHEPGEQEKILAAVSVTRFYGGSKTAKQVILHADLEQFKAERNSAAPATTRGKTSHRIENTNLMLIGAMIDLLKRGDNFKSEAEIIDAIKEAYPSCFGLGQRTIEGRFAKAKKALADNGD